MLKKAICINSVTPLRKEQNERSEMVSQVLFGETFQVLEETIKWSLIKLTDDEYIGWVDNKSIKIISDENFEKIISGNSVVCQKLTCTIVTQNDDEIILPAGSILPNFNESTNTFQIEEDEYTLKEDHILLNGDVNSIAKQFVNSPYLWGGKNPFGIDCSGFIQVIYKTMGYKIPRDSSQQVSTGNSVNFISDSLSGDIAFFDDNEGNIVHVGMLLNHKEIIHASGKVRIDMIDQQGIYNAEIKKYTHKLRVIKRILNNS